MTCSIYPTTRKHGNDGTDNYGKNKANSKIGRGATLQVLSVKEDRQEKKK
jgi:hypothetical protein